MFNLTQIKIFGDIFQIRKAYDIDDSGIGRYGFDIYNEDGDFLCHFVGNRMNELRRYIKMNLYKNYEGTYSYYE